MGAAWLKFYPTDWRADPALRMCSLAARGLWMEMLCVMHEAAPRGFLLVNGRSVTSKQLSGLVGCPPKDIDGLIQELEDAGVFSRDNAGTIFSRRIIRDDEKAERDKANGKGGGNPRLKGGVNPPDKPQGPNGITSPRARINQKPEAREERKNQDLSSHHLTTQIDAQKEFSSKAKDLDNLEIRCREAAGLENDPSAGLFVIGPIFDLIEAGWSLEAHILPAMKSARARGKRGKTWDYYAKIVTNNQSSPPKPIAPPALRIASSPFDDPANWPIYLKNWKGGNWPGTWGPQPNEPGCRISAEFVAQFERQANGVAA